MAEVGVLSPDDRVELIEGELIDMPPIGERHARGVDMLAKRLIRAVGESAYLRIQGPVRLGAHSVPHPDLILLAASTDSYRTAPPTGTDVLLIIEVSESTLRYDLEVKAPLYARHEVPEYWVLDLVNNALHRFRLPTGGYYAQHDVVKTRIVRFEALSVDVDIEDLF